MSTDTDWARGIDVSQWNGSTPNLKGRDFAFARACYGTQQDVMYDQHTRNFRKAGSVAGAYAFGIYGDAAVQARAFLRIAGDADLLALDLEKEPNKPRMTFDQARRFIGTVQESGRSCGLYYSDWRFPSLGQDWNWVAKWGGDPPERTWTFWQYRGYPLDLNYFNGDTDDLYRFAEMAGGSELIRSRGALVMKGANAAFTKRVRITKDTAILDTPGGSRIAGAPKDRLYPYVGYGAKATRAVLINTDIPYTDGQPGPTVLYVAATASVVEDAPVPPSGGDVVHTVTISVDGVQTEQFEV